MGLTAARAFDRLALRYDEVCAGTLFRRMRRQVHATLAGVFPPESRVLEIGCGSGADTAFLARHGVHVVACDPAPGMIQRTRERLSAPTPRGTVQFIGCGVEDLDGHLGPALTFDGLLSDFGALNCVERLDSLGALAARRIRPGGRVILCLISRTCLLEMLWFLARGAPRQAFRRLSTPPVRVPVEGLDVPTWYHRVADVQAALGPNFVLRRVTGLSVLLPPPYLEARWETLPRAVRGAIDAADGALAAWWPFNRLGDHTMLEFENVRIQEFEDVRI